MISLKKVVLVLFMLGAALVGCDGEYDSLVDANADRNPIPDTEVEASQGDADFTNYVAIGNSLTAGYMDGALYNNGQDFSLAAQISGQFELTGAPVTFNQPDINSVNGYNTLANTGSGPVLGRFKLDTSIPGPSPTISGDPIGPYTGTTSALNNFGVPGIQLGQLLTPATGDPNLQNNPAFNPFYARFASAPGTSTILGDVLSADPTFFTLWIGNNDVLGYATSGATRPEILTSQANFQAQFSAVINSLMMETSASGVVANIPPILATPIFRAVPYNAIELDQESANQLNTSFSQFNMVLDGLADSGLISEEDAERRKVNYQSGNNPILIVDPNLNDLSDEFDLVQAVNPRIGEAERAALQPYVQSRPMVVDPQTGPELVLLSAGSVLGTPAIPGNPNTPTGVAIPLGAEYTLTSENIIEIETARATFNAIIEGTVTAAGGRLALFDTNKLGGAFADIFGLDGSQPGISVDGVFLNPDFSPNGVFSTDGVHPNARGNAILANEFLRVIETEFNASIPKIDVTSLPSVSLCAGDCESQQGGS